MPMRTCKTCGKAENPLGRLRFKKSRMDGQIYCENCAPLQHSQEPAGRVPEELSTLQSVVPGQPEALEIPAHPAHVLPQHKPSAGYVVVACPDCAGGVHRPRVKPCGGCAGYGAVRITANMLNVYRLKPTPAPEILTEG